MRLCDPVFHRELRKLAAATGRKIEKKRKSYGDDWVLFLFSAMFVLAFPWIIAKASRWAGLPGGECDSIFLGVLSVATMFRGFLLSMVMWNSGDFYPYRHLPMERPVYGFLAIQNALKQAGILLLENSVVILVVVLKVPVPAPISGFLISVISLSLIELGIALISLRFLRRVHIPAPAILGTLGITAVLFGWAALVNWLKIPARLLLAILEKGAVFGDWISSVLPTGKAIHFLSKMSGAGRDQTVLVLGEIFIWTALCFGVGIGFFPYLRNAFLSEISYEPEADFDGEDDFFEEVPGASSTTPGELAERNAGGELFRMTNFEAKGWIEALACRVLNAPERLCLDALADDSDLNFSKPWLRGWLILPFFCAVLYGFLHFKLTTLFAFGAIIAVACFNGSYLHAGLQPNHWRLPIRPLDQYRVRMKLGAIRFVTALPMVILIGSFLGEVTRLSFGNAIALATVSTAFFCFERGFWHLNQSQQPASPRAALARGCLVVAGIALWPLWVGIAVKVILDGESARLTDTGASLVLIAASFLFSIGLIFMQNRGRLTPAPTMPWQSAGSE